MPIVNMLEARTNLSRLVGAIETGAEAEIVIARNGKPVAKLVPVATPARGQRLGVAAGRFTVPDDIDADNDLIEALFSGRASESAK